MKKSNIQIVLSYLSFLRKSKSIHSVHSPFLFQLIEAIVKQKNEDSFIKIEKERKRLLSDTKLIQGIDYGAGSRKTGQKSIKQIAKTALKKKREAKILFVIAKHLQCENILELGTSLGITSSYLAHSNKNANVISMEGNSAIAQEAQNVFANLNLENIKIIEGNIDYTLGEALSSFNQLDLAFIDANHKKEPCLRYFKQILPNCHNDSVLVFDDIHWSDEMEQAWAEIKNHKKVRVSVDLFYFGLVFLRQEMTKQHFTIRV